MEFRCSQYDLERKKGVDDCCTHYNTVSGIVVEMSFCLIGMQVIIFGKDDFHCFMYILRQRRLDSVMCLGRSVLDIESLHFVCVVLVSILK